MIDNKVSPVESANLKTFLVWKFPIDGIEIYSETYETMERVCRFWNLGEPIANVGFALELEHKDKGAVYVKCWDRLAMKHLLAELANRGVDARAIDGMESHLLPEGT